jgi:hypothetical protein
MPASKADFRYNVLYNKVKYGLDKELRRVRNRNVTSLSPSSSGLLGQMSMGRKESGLLPMISERYTSRQR